MAEESLVLKLFNFITGLLIYTRMEKNEMTFNPFAGIISGNRVTNVRMGSAFKV